MSMLIPQWQSVRQQCADLAAANGHAVTLIAVSKTFPAADIRTLYEAGQRDFGENYIQEWQQKCTELANTN